MHRQAERQHTASGQEAGKFLAIVLKCDDTNCFLEFVEKGLTKDDIKAIDADTGKVIESS